METSPSNEVDQSVDQVRAKQCGQRPLLTQVPLKPLRHHRGRIYSHGQDTARLAHGVVIDVDEMGAGIEDPRQTLATQHIADRSRSTKLVQQRDGMYGLVDTS